MSVSLGLGRHFYHVDNFDNIIMIARLGQVNIVSSILAAVLSKTSFAVTLLRLGEKITIFKVAIWFIIISINVFMNTGIVSGRSNTAPRLFLSPAEILTLSSPIGPQLRPVHPGQKSMGDLDSRRLLATRYCPQIQCFRRR